MKKLFTLLMTMIVATGLWAQSLTVTYTAGDIPTDYQSPWVGPSSCPGEMTVTIPAGNWITGIDVAYDMTTGSGAWMSEQRSRLYSPTTMAGEPEYYAGTENTGGTFSYNRTGLTFANFGTGDVVIQMDAGRTWGGSDCNTTYNKVDNNTWTMTVYYEPIPACPAPFALTATNITINSADLGWTSAGTENMWNIKYGAPGFDPLTEGTLVADVTTNPYTLTGLDALTNYEFYVQANCGGGDLSDWGGPGAFQTISSFISGTYTINSALPTDGNNFNNFSDLATALNTGGVDGALIVNVVAGSGPYNEQVMFEEVAGVNDVNTITINGNGETLQYLSTESGARHTFALNGTDYVTVDNLIIKALGEGSGEYGFAVQLQNEADHNTFTNCQFISNMTATGTAFACFVASNSNTSATTAGLAASNLTIDGCFTQGGYYGITLQGPTDASGDPNAQNNVITNTEVKDFRLYGIYLRGQNNAVISNNELSRPDRTEVSTTYMIYFRDNMSGTEITNNRIFDFAPNASSTSGAYGIYGTTTTSDVGSELLVANNLIYGFEGMNGIQRGMALFTTNHIKVYHNTISVDNVNHTGSSAIQGIYHTGNEFTIDIRNNIISVTSNSTGTKHCLYFSQTAANIPVLTSDHNVLHMGATAGTNHIAYWQGGGGPDFTTLADWQLAGFDANSVDSDPMFTLPAIGDLTPQNPDVDNIGADLLAFVPEDFFGVARTTTPDPGAIEFSPPSCVPVSDIEVHDVTTTTAEISWTAGGTESLWNIKYGMSGFDPLTEGTDIIGVLTNTHVITGLDAATPYDVYVQADCGGGDISSWTGPASFVTECETFTVYPYMEGFENEFPPLCWDYVNGEPGAYWEKSSVATYSGNFAARAYQGVGSSYVADEWLITPAFDLDQASELWLRFYGYCSQAPNLDKEKMRIVMLDQVYDNVADLHLNGVEIAVKFFTQTWEEYMVDLSAYTGVKYFAFNYYITENVGFNWMYIDDVEFFIPPQYYTVDFSVVGANGTLNAEVDGVPITSGDEILEESDVVFTAVPDANYQIKEWKLDGVVIPGHTSPTYTYFDLQDDINVTVEFEMITHEVTFAVVGTNGTLDAAVNGTPISSGDPVNQTSDVVFTATPDQDYRVKEWKQDGVVVPDFTENVYTVQNLMAAVDVTVEFEEIPIVPGDVNGDGVIDVLDVTSIVAYIMGQNPEPFIFGAADVNGDGEINVLDIILTVNIILDNGGKASRVINSLPADMILGDGFIKLSSDGTLAGLQFEINGWNRQYGNLQLALPGFELVHTVENGTLKGMIFSMNGNVIPQGAHEFITFEGKAEELSWNNAFGGNSNGERVKVNTRDMFNRIEQLYEISAYPNPTRENFAAMVYVPVASRINVKAIDANGHEYLIVREAVVEAGSSRYRSNVAGSLPPGTYILQLNAEPLRMPRTSIRKEVRVVIL